MGRRSQALRDLLAYGSRERHTILAERGRLRPGIYVNTAGSLWRRVGESVPGHLRRTRAELPAIDHLRVGRVLQSLARLVSHLPPRFLLVRRRVGDRGGYVLAVPANGGGCVLLDPERGSVARTFGYWPTPAEQLELRRRWAGQVASPRFEPTEGGRVLLEEYIAGSSLDDVSDEIRRDALRTIFRQYTALARAEGTGTTAGTIRDVERVLSAQVLPDLLQQALTHPGALASARTWPLVPTPTDCYPQNFIHADERGLVFIDPFPLRLRPCFETPIAVVVKWGRVWPWLRSAYLDGSFDAELAALFDAVGGPSDVSLELRQFLLALGVLEEESVRARLEVQDPDPGAVAAACLRVMRSYRLDDPADWVPA